MIQVKEDERAMVAELFDGIEDSMVIAYLQGYMGCAYVRTADAPQAAVLISGEYSFWGGNCDSKDAAYLAEHFFDVNPNGESIGIFADAHPRWEQTLIACKKNHPRIVPRFRIAQKDYDFDLEQLAEYRDALPVGFEPAPFDKRIYEMAMAADWSKEFCETFDSAKDYLQRGFGFAALKDGELVSGASTMTVYDGGTEIQVATREDCRQKGLALPCAAAMILECTNRNIRPCWDAANEISKKMALKLGYEYEGEYTTIHMRRT